MAVPFWLVVGITCLNLHFSVSSVNYCGAKMCEQPNSHTLCKYNRGPGPRCTGYIKADLSSEDKARILARMNRRRSEVAAGLARNLPPAADMLKLRWVEELAREAQLWADQCSPIQTPEEKDDCRDLYSTTVGQCIATVVGEAPGLKPSSMVDMWYLQSLKYRWNVTRDPPPSNSYEYEDFTQMLWAKAYMVGCARIRFMAPWRGHHRSVERLVCNVAPRGPGGAPPWSPGAPASACPPHSNYDRDLPSLCSYPSSFGNAPHTQGIDGEIKREDILLQTVLQLEQNRSIDYLGSLDESFLTKLAIATIATSDNDLKSTQMYSSFGKGDEEFSEKSYKLVDAQNNLQNDLLGGQQKLISAREIENIKTATKLSLIGRPKTYNIDELSDVDEENSVENLHLKRRREEKRHVTVDPDLYIDTGNVNSRTDPENNSGNIESDETLRYESTSQGITIDLREKDNNRGPRMKDKSIILVSDEETYFETTTLTPKTTEYLTTLSPEIDLNENLQYSKYMAEVTTVTKNDESSLSHESIYIRAPSIHPLNKSEEEYLSDPETAREIQAALDKIENELSQSMTLPTLPPLPPLPPLHLQGKVRRDLNGFAPRLGQEHPKDSISKTTDGLLKKKNITDEGPIFRMMQHYAPYFSQYKESFRGGANLFVSSVVLVTTLSWLVTIALTV